MIHEIAVSVFIVLGCVAVLLSAVGAVRMPDVYTQVHASSKAVFLGVIALLAASVATRDGATVARAVLTAVFLTLTTPVAGHIVARAAYRAGERMETPGAVDECRLLQKS